MTLLDPPDCVHRPGDVAIAFAKTIQRVRNDILPFAAVPLRYMDAAPAETVGRAIAALYETLAGSDGPSPAAMLAAVLDELGVAPGAGERQAAMVAAVLATVPCNNQFHNADHSREVLGNAIWLSRANAVLAGATPGALKLPADAVARLLLAAMMHDIGHDGTTNAVPAADGTESYVPFRLEDRAFELMHPSLQRAGIAPAAIAALQVMLRATDPRARAGVRVLTDAALYGTPPGAAPSAFVDHLRDPELALATALLCDADLMSSVGLTYAYYQRQSAALAAERGAPIAPAETRDFFTKVVGNGFSSAAGKRLDANLMRIRAAALSG